MADSAEEVRREKEQLDGSGHAFISVNCASIPASLIASELFGHEKGAFTGAPRSLRVSIVPRGRLGLCRALARQAEPGLCVVAAELG